LIGELTQTYPTAGSKLGLVPNPVDVDRMRPPESSTREEIRAQFGIQPDELALVFVALGHFERKGLPLLLDAVQLLKTMRVKLLVAGGERGLVMEYRRRCEEMGIGRQVRFDGMQRDLRPYYWAADAFVFPSCYETFCLVAFEAAAAAVPLLVTAVNGVEEFIDDGRNGLLIERSPESIVDAIRRLAALAPAERRAMGECARRSVQRYGRDEFVSAWKDFYECLA